MEGNKSGEKRKSNMSKEREKSCGEWWKKNNSQKHNKNCQQDIDVIECNLLNPVLQSLLNCTNIFKETACGIYFNLLILQVLNVIFKDKSVNFLSSF